MSSVRWLKKPVLSEPAHQSSSGTLSVCMIVKNEAALLRRCLESVRSIADEVVVVDTGSTDTTISVARDCGAIVIESPWRDDFAFSRNVSIEHASSSWILWLDADDVVPVQSLQPLAELKKKVADRVFGFIVRNERPGNTGSEFTQARMFPRHSSLRFERSIHEQIMPSALRIGMILEQHPVVIEHHGYADPATLKKKASRNIEMLLREYPAVAPDPVMATEIADSCWLIEDLDGAFKWYNTAVTLLEKHNAMPALLSHAYYGIGNVFNRREMFGEAIGHFISAQKLAPWRPDILYSLAVAFELSDRVQDSIDALVRILPMQPAAGQVGVDFRAAKIKAYLRLIRILIDEQHMNDAAPYVSDALEQVGTRPEIQTLAGKYYLKSGALMDALHAFEKSITLHQSGNLDAYIGLCCVYRMAGRTDLVQSTIETLAGDFDGTVRFKAAQRSLLGIALGKQDNEQLIEGFRILQRDFFGMLPQLSLEV